VRHAQSHKETQDVKIKHRDYSFSHCHETYLKCPDVQKSTVPVKPTILYDASHYVFYCQLQGMAFCRSHGRE